MPEAPEPVALPMPDPAATASRVHCRRITAEVLRRSDGLWALIGRMEDVKDYAFTMEERGRLEPGDPVHRMVLTLILTDDLTICAAEAETLAAPFAYCRGATEGYAALRGLKIGPGWMKEVQRRLGGPRGCTHLTELLPVMATTAFQGIASIVSRERREARTARGEPEPQRTTPPPLLDSCHSFAASGPIAARLWPEWTRPQD